MTLIVFDFDGTLSDSEMTVLLGQRHGVAETMAEITDRAMNGTLSYTESLRKRAALLKGLSELDVAAAYDSIRLRDNAAAVIDDANASGMKTAILSGGFERGVRSALRRAGVSVDYIIANTLVIDGGELTGEVDGGLVENAKDVVLGGLASAQSIEMEDTVAVGDGANDLPMLNAAGLSVGYEPKPAVAPHCDVVVTSMGELQETLRDRGFLEADRQRAQHT